MPKKHGTRKHAGAPPQVQLPLVHPSAVFPHDEPQRPQCERLVWVLTQLPSQHCSLPPHVRPQAPQLPTVSSRTHDAAAPDPQHAVPALQPAPPPQRQAPPMHVSPGPQAGEQGVSMHVPAVHDWVAEHAMPQPPQLLRSVWTSMHASPQQRVPPVHGAPSPH